MPRYFLQIAYDGTAFHGSQLQGETPTVQLALNRALSTLLRQQISTFGASRTDEGVHALKAMYHFDLLSEAPAKLLYSLNSILPSTVSAVAIFLANDPGQNARFDALSRSYRYRIYRKKDPFRFNRACFFPFKLQREVLDETAAEILAHTDFTSFSKRNAQTKTNICTIRESRWEDHGQELHYFVKGNRFLRGMVRALVGTQLNIARGRQTADDFRKIILAKDCTGADFSVPGFGLYLEDIEYPAGALTLLQS